MTVALMRKGPCLVKYGGVTIGQTEGDVVFKYSPEWRQFMPDQSTGAQRAFLVKEAVEVKVPLVPRADAWDLIRANAFPAGLKKSTPTAGDGATTVDGDHAAGVTTLAVADGSVFAVGDVIKIGAGQTIEYRAITAIDTNDLTVAATSYAHAGGEAVADVKGSSLSGAEAVGQTVIGVSVDDDFTQGDVVMIGEGAKAELRTISSVGTGDVTLSEAIGFAHAAGELMFVLDADPKLKFSVGNNRSNIQYAELIIDPLDGSDDIKVYKALCTSEVELPLKKEEESVIELTYVGIEDTTRTSGDRLAAIGDQSVA
jgi:hypothetical protein